MDASDGFTSRPVVIIGLGLMGGSLGLALRRGGIWVGGLDPDPQACALAVEMGAVDEAAMLPAAAPPAALPEQAAALLAEAQAIVLAAPVLSILNWVEALRGNPALHPGEAIVFDLGSTKSDIAAAMRSLPERFAPIGGHPMCGKEHNSIRFAEAGLFIDAPFALTPLERTPAAARAWAQTLVEAVGARPLWLEAHTHDAWAAAVSHAPYCLAACLAAATPPEALPLAGPGLRSTTRVAGTSPMMMEHILHTNRLNVLEALERVRLHLDRLEDALRDENWASLHECLLAGQESYAKIRL